MKIEYIVIVAELPFHKHRLSFETATIDPNEEIIYDEGMKNPSKPIRYVYDILALTRWKGDIQMNKQVSNEVISVVIDDREL